MIQKLIVKSVDRVTGLTDYTRTTTEELDRTLEMLDDAGMAVKQIYLDMEED